MSEPKKVLFLDDRSKRLHAALKKYAPPEYDLTLVCTAKECIKKLSNEGPWDIVSLDHDLGFEEFVDSSRPDCGMEVIRFLVSLASIIYSFPQKREWMMIEGGYGVEEGIGTVWKEKQPKTKFIIHSSNRIAGLIMKRELIKNGYLAEYERFNYGGEV